ncbi:MAG TPA: amidohydrolase [Chitinophagaceae bacterium]
MDDVLRFSGVQADLVWENKEANLQHLEEKIRGLAGKTQIVVLPEMFSTGFSMSAAKLAENMEGETIRWMKRVAAESRVIVTGSVIIEDNGSYYNRLVWALPNGEPGYYDKRHLFAYADEHSHYSPGGRRLIASAAGWKINLLICYDLRFPVWSRQKIEDHGSDEAPASPEYDVLVYVASWPKKRIEAWKTLLRARAIENQAFVIGVNRVGTDGNGIVYPGQSMVVDPAGEVLHAAGDETEVFTVPFERSRLTYVREKFPFWKDADGFLLTTKKRD